jgi:hypothetical protein
MKFLRAFVLSLTCIVLCIGTSVAQHTSTSTATATAAAPSAAAPAAPEEIQAAMQEYDMLLSEGQHLHDLYAEAQAAGECEDDECEPYKKMLLVAKRMDEVNSFLKAQGVQTPSLEYEVDEYDDECPFTYQVLLQPPEPTTTLCSASRADDDFVLYSTGEYAGATCKESRAAMRELIKKAQAELVPQAR